MIKKEARLGCGAAIVHDGRLLLIRRLREPEANCWGLPGGKVDWLEPLEHAVQREIHEELGIHLHGLKLLCVVDQIAPDRHEHWVAPVYLATSFDGVPHIAEPHKHSSLAWFALDSLPEPLTTATRTAILKLHDHSL